MVNVGRTQPKKGPFDLFYSTRPTTRSSKRNAQPIIESTPEPPSEPPARSSSPTAIHPPLPRTQQSRTPYDVPFEASSSPAASSPSPRPPAQLISSEPDYTSRTTYEDPDTSICTTDGLDDPPSLSSLGHDSHDAAPLHPSGDNVGASEKQQDKAANRSDGDKSMTSGPTSSPADSPLFAYLRYAGLATPAVSPSDGVKGTKRQETAGSNDIDAREGEVTTSGMAGCTAASDRKSAETDSSKIKKRAADSKPSGENSSKKAKTERSSSAAASSFLPPSTRPPFLTSSHPINTSHGGIPSKVKSTPAPQTLTFDFRIQRFVPLKLAPAPSAKTTPTGGNLGIDIVITTPHFFCPISMTLSITRLPPGVDPANLRIALAFGGPVFCAPKSHFGLAHRPWSQGVGKGMAHGDEAGEKTCHWETLLALDARTDPELAKQPGASVAMLPWSEGFGVASTPASKTSAEKASKKPKSARDKVKLYVTADGRVVTAGTFDAMGNYKEPGVKAMLKGWKEAGPLKQI